MNDVSGVAQGIREREDTGRQALRVVEEQDLGHAGILTVRPLGPR